MARLKGSWVVEWTDDDGDHAIELRVPLSKPRPAAKVVAYTRDSLDYSQREVSSIGAGVYELIFDIKFMDNSQALVDMMLAGAKGKTLTLVPDADDPDREWDCDMIEPTAGQLSALMDSDAGEYEYHQGTIRLRRTNGEAFDL